ncbi:hypothetical protein EC912_107121 [Luteibacter rhizovicinus]|uniref:Uncharacterized protein n=1 Tax=Luteibacter rhizovicinus TaxID=242606 RepID=A0A4R3YNG7_9GAMM|nr:hypothetical protein [Luteibacter rhizovicinus]TCV92413.1 hypothetical protein EC912_107121 [Luteibacter rhizovicinus]
MPTNPTSPGPPFAEPGKQRPDSEIRRPGSYRPAREADPEPLALDDPEEEANYLPLHQ